MSRLTRIVLVVLLALPAIALAADAQPLAADAVIEARTLALAEELRCLVCQNQTIADSQAGLAVDLKNQIREQLRAGATEKDVIEFMVARYGDFVLYRPPLKFTTFLLWSGPFVLLLAAGTAAFLYLRRRQRDQTNQTPADAKQLAHVAALLQPPEGHL